MNELNELFGEVIHSYTREQAIEDGTLVELPIKDCVEAGIKTHVAVTRSVYFDFIHWTDKDSKRQTPQDESGRLWDLVWMLANAMRSPFNENKSELLFALYVVPRGDKSRARKPRKTVLKAVIDGGDKGIPVITIMQLDES
jgi:hypothetical protein